jgi:hypothetical protein
MSPRLALTRFGGAAALLVALAGCDRTPLGLDISSVTGVWTTQPLRYTYATPEGLRGLDRVETWTLSPDHRYVREAWLYDVAGAKAYVDFREEGTFTIPTPGVLAFRTSRAFYRNSDQYLAQPPMHATMGETLRFTFTLGGDGLLTADRFCDPLPEVDCVTSDPTVLHRALLQ